MLNETKLITYLQQQFPQQIGDDAAVIPFSDQQRYIISQDILSEDVHYRRRYQSAASLANKSLQVNLSDIAAMGAEASFALLATAIPLAAEEYYQTFIRHFSQCCHRENMILIGGDTTRSANGLFISITLIGIAHPQEIKYRRHAKPGDVLCVAGQLGHAHVGLQALENNIDGLDDFKQSFLSPQAKMKAGKWLGQQGSVHAMMDISDGLYVDLKRLCQASSVGAELTLEQLSNDSSFTQACELLRLDPIQTKLAGGEDYGLLITVAEKDYPSLALAFEQQLPDRLLKIGTINDSQAIRLSSHGAEQNLTIDSFSHFGEKR